MSPDVPRLDYHEDPEGDPFVCQFAVPGEFMLFCNHPDRRHPFHYKPCRVLREFGLCPRGVPPDPTP